MKLVDGQILEFLIMYVELIADVRIRIVSALKNE